MPIVSGSDTTSEINVQIDGESISTKVADLTSEELLQEILKQLKIMNMHLMLITDSYISKRDILE